MKAGKKIILVNLEYDLLCHFIDKHVVKNMSLREEQFLNSMHYSINGHLNAEIASGTISNISDAMEWLRSSYLYTRMRKNPPYYCEYNCKC